MNVEKIRADFPILRNKIYGKRLSYLDNAASSQKPMQVVESISASYTKGYSNVHRGAHYLGNLVTDKYEKTRSIIKSFINAKSDKEVIFTRGATEAINLVASSYAVKNLKQDDEIIITLLEHHSNIVPWYLLKERYGIKLNFAKIDDNGNIDLDFFKSLFNAKTKFVSVSHLSNVLGTVMPAKELVKIAHSYNVPVLLDGCQAIPHIKVDVQDLDCDFYVFSGHKIYGPTGVGVLYGKHSLLSDLPPYSGGGEMINEVTTDKISFREVPYRFEAGTPPIIQVIGLGAAINYFSSLNPTAIDAHEDKLLSYATEKLSEIDNLKIVGSAKKKKSIISFTMKGIHPHDIATVVDREGVAIRAGHHCCQPLMNFLKLPATARASLAMYNNEEDIDKLFESLIKCKKMFS